MALAEGRRLHQLADSDPGRRQPWRPGLVVVDAGTGSGAIALALASELGPGLLREVWATDVSADALEVAAANVEARRASGWRSVPSPVSSSPRGAGSRRCRRAAGGGRPGRRQPALRVRRRMGRAGGRGARRAAPGPRGRARQRRHARAGRRGGAAGGVPGLVGAAGQRRRGAGTPPGRARSAARPSCSATTRFGSSPTSRGGRAPWSYGPAADGSRDGVTAPGTRAATARGARGREAHPPLVGAGAGEVVGALEAGSIIAVPAVGGYSLAVRAGSPEAETRLAELAADTDGPHFAVGHTDAVRALTSGWTDELARLLERCWPGPVEVFVSAAGAAAMGPDGAGAGTGVWAAVVGMPDGRPLRRLCREHGPWRTVPLRFTEAAEVARAFDAARRGVRGRRGTPRRAAADAGGRHRVADPGPARGGTRRPPSSRGRCS